VLCLGLGRIEAVDFICAAPYYYYGIEALSWLVGLGIDLEELVDACVSAGRSQARNLEQAVVCLGADPLWRLTDAY
jgi:hypothetical protein